MDEEKRVAPRFSFVEPVSCGVADCTVNGAVAGNISLSGVSLRVQQFIPVGAVLELQIQLERLAKVLWVKAKVVRVREVLTEDCYEIGLQFFRDEECIKAVGRYTNNCRAERSEEPIKDPSALKASG